MKDIFSELFFGEIIPYEQFSPKTKEYQEACETYNRMCGSFEKELEEKSSSLYLQWKEVENRNLVIIRMEQAAAFSFGFRLAVRLIGETYQTDTGKWTRAIGKSFKYAERKACRKKKASCRLKKR